MFSSLSFNKLANTYLNKYTFQTIIPCNKLTKKYIYIQFLNLVKIKLLVNKFES